MQILTGEEKIYLLSIGHAKKLDELFKSLNNSIGCTYLTYMMEMPGRKIYFSSHPEWQNQMAKNKLMNICPIYSCAFKALNSRPPTKTRNIIMIWDYVPHRKGEESDLKDFRTSFNIAHGIGVAIRHGDIRESIVFAGAKDDKYFFNKIINTNIMTNSLQIFNKNINKGS